MKKSTCLKEIQKRLPDEIIVQDQTDFEFTDDEFVGILSWIKYLNTHYKELGMSENPKVLFPVISKRLFIDFGLYIIPDETNFKDKCLIYISPTGKRLDGKVNRNMTVKDIKNIWHL